MPDPITESALRLRLDPFIWPEALKPNATLEVTIIHKALLEAQDLFARFGTFHHTLRASGQHTPLGIVQATKEWAEVNLPAQRERLERIRATAEKVERNLVEQLTHELTVQPEGAEVALLQEVRAWLRALPELQRLDRARTLAVSGDKTALRALLTAPAWLSGVDEELLHQIRDEAAKRDYPDRYAKLEIFRQAASVAERALAGVIQYVEQEAARPPVRTGVIVEAEPQPRPDPDVQHRIRLAAEQAGAPIFEESQAA